MDVWSLLFKAKVNRPLAPQLSPNSAQDAARGDGVGQSPVRMNKGNGKDGWSASVLDPIVDFAIEALAPPREQASPEPTWKQ